MSEEYSTNENINLLVSFLKNSFFYMQIWFPLYIIYRLIINKSANSINNSK